MNAVVEVASIKLQEEKEQHGIIPDLLALKVPAASVQEDPKNARCHTDESTLQVSESLRLYGQRKPIVINAKTGFVEAGNGTLRAARKLGWSHIAAVRVDDDHKTATGYAIADNRVAELSDWDHLALKALFDSIDNPLEIPGVDNDWLKMLAWSDEKPTSISDVDIIPVPPKNPVSRPGDLWCLGEHRLLCGSSTVAEDVIRLMKGERAILFATDPPYLVDYDGTNHPPNRRDKEKAAKKGKEISPLAGNKDWSDSYAVTWDDSSQGPELYEGFIRAAIDHAISDHAAWYCWHASRRQAMLEAVWEKMGAFVHQQIIWNKNSPVLTRTHYLWKHEPCFFGWVRGNRPEKLENAEPAYSVWDIQGLAGDARPDHPTPKPLDCFAIPMRQHVPPGGLCYEPFSGSGSQIMAGELVGRRVYAMEISPVYVDVAVQRFTQTTGKIVYLEGSGGKSFEDVAAERGIDLAA
ncbi:MAG: DNA modification methylase [Magnetococcales bacterium]|nr:DNA modification methylase [Magnetococcales bacterium]MBF0116952.1 DNA modification methylase [Magnetococcales bacterium]